MEQVRVMKQTLGQSRIEALYPLTKFYLAIVVMGLAVAIPGFKSKIICLLFLNVLAAVSGCYTLFLNRVQCSVGILFVILVVVQTLFHPGEQVIFSFWIFSAKMEGLMMALNLGLLLLNVGGSLIWFFAVTKEKDFVLSLEKLGISPRASYIVLSTLQMVPVLKKKSQMILDAQKARGMETEGSLVVRAKAFIPTIVPLVLSSIQGMEERALTLEARGFSSEAKRVHLYDIQAKPVDKLLCILISAAWIMIAVWRGVL